MVKVSQPQLWLHFLVKLWIVLNKQQQHLDLLGAAQRKTLAGDALARLS